MLPVTPHVKFIGVDDDNLDLFEGQYPVPNGISYNSYLIDDENIAVVDAVDIRRCSEWLALLDSTLDGRHPAYLIVQHMEPDHSGSIRAVLEKYPEMKVVATAKAIAMLDNFFDGMGFSERSISVKDGDTLSLGHTTLRFITAPMVHWPEVMMTLDETDGVLFSADAFGTFATSNATEGWDNEARRYYCNIVGKYGSCVQAVMKKLTGLPFGIIAPLHGPILKENLAHYWNLYDKWSRYIPETEGVLVAYASIYGGTAEAARRLADMLRSRGAGDVVLIDLCRHDVSYAVAEAFRLSRLALCSVTYDGAMFPAMHNFLHHLAAKNFSGRHVGILENGSWAPTAGKLMCKALAEMKDMTVVGSTVTIRSRLHDSDIASLSSLALALAERHSSQHPTEDKKIIAPGARIAAPGAINFTGQNPIICNWTINHHPSTHLIYLGLEFCLLLIDTPGNQRILA